MQEIQPEGNAVREETQPEETETMSQAENTARRGSHEPLWGILLIAGMLIFVIASIGGIGWVVYSQWQDARLAKEQPSITALVEQPSEVEPASAASPQADTAQGTDSKEQTPTDSTVAAKALAISVQNGGGAKGSAGTLTDFLKTQGYSKAVAGNTLKNYTGTTVYYAANFEKEAEAIQTSVAKKYPQVKVLPADATNEETSVSLVTIIIGK